MASVDTIAAIATPPGRGGVGIVRVSGKNTQSIARQILKKIPRARFAHYTAFVDQHDHVIDLGLALFFPGPNSFTGEDVLEFHAHGGAIVLDQLLQAVITAGARIAQPGEFTQRAFLNDKIDLTQAEAIADLIDATSTQAARSAVRSLQGEFSQRIQPQKVPMSRVLDRSCKTCEHDPTDVAPNQYRGHLVSFLARQASQEDNELRLNRPEIRIVRPCY